MSPQPMHSNHPPASLQAPLVAGRRKFLVQVGAGAFGDKQGRLLVRNLDRDRAGRLTCKGYIPGVIKSNDAARDAGKWSGWSASGEVVGVDGKVRRWVYLHYFKPGQPTPYRQFPFVGLAILVASVVIGYVRVRRNPSAGATEGMTS